MPNDPFFVYIVESPSSDDFYNRVDEGKILCDALRLDGTPAITRTVISKANFQAALTAGIAEAIGEQGARVPVVHISAHGDENGLELSSKERISWRELADLLRPVNSTLKGELVVTMSCCMGSAGSQMAHQVADGGYPFSALVGSSSEPEWSDTVAGFLAFYHRSRKGASLDDAVVAMRAASGHNEFQLHFAVEARERYLARLKPLAAKFTQRQLLEIAMRLNPGTFPNVGRLYGGMTIGDFIADTRQ